MTQGIPIPRILWDTTTHNKYTCYVTHCALSHGILSVLHIMSHSVAVVLLIVSHIIIVGCVTCTWLSWHATIDGHLLSGVQNRLKHNIHVQRLGQKAAEDVELEAIRRQSNYRVEVSLEYVSHCQCYYIMIMSILARDRSVCILHCSQFLGELFMSIVLPVSSAYMWSACAASVIHDHCSDRIVNVLFE